MKIDVNQFLKPCSCGRKHEIVVDDIIIDSGAINQLPEILKRPAYADKKSLVMICDENTYEAAGKQVEVLVCKADGTGERTGSADCGAQQRCGKRYL